MKTGSTGRNIISKQMIREEPGGGQEGKQGRILRDNIKTWEEPGEIIERTEEEQGETGEDIISKQMIREPYPKKS